MLFLGIEILIYPSQHVPSLFRLSPAWKSMRTYTPQLNYLRARSTEGIPPSPYPTLPHFSRTFSFIHWFFDQFAAEHSSARKGSSVKRTSELWPRWKPSLAWVSLKRYFSFGIASGLSENSISTSIVTKEWTGVASKNAFRELFWAFLITKALISVERRKRKCKLNELHTLGRRIILFTCLSVFFFLLFQYLNTLHSEM